ncbi:MAG: hypothetical protein RIQ79_2604 [Verrucomicrobiota bacterium]|jgi:hypothetical protein
MNHALIRGLASLSLFSVAALALSAGEVKDVVKHNGNDPAVASASYSQNIFVCLGGKSKGGNLVIIPAPGHGWNYSAVAPVPGDTWNRISRTAGVDASDARLTPGDAASKLGLKDLDTAKDVGLMDSLGQPTAAHLTIQIEVLSLATDKARQEPATYSKSKGALPVALMECSWRVFLPENSLRFTIADLMPGQVYDLYVYASSTDPVTNPTGKGEGARFTLAPDNIVHGDLGTAETEGGYGGGIFTYSPETDAMAPSPLGTTWSRLPVVADGKGQLVFKTTSNASRRHFVNGFQLIGKTP